jgi:rhamnose utilization protein RhaD (predicted bifunctional aldolase and dehydrogenase)
LLLANHGIVVAGETLEDVRANLHRVCSLCEPDNIYRPTPQKSPISQLKINGAIYNPVNENHLHALATDHHLFSLIKRHWALYPDHVVFLGPQPIILESIAQASHSKAIIREPFIFIKGSGVWQRSDVTLAALAQLQCYYDVLIRLEKNCRLANLTEQQIGELLDWDAEKHRQALNK